MRIQKWLSQLGVASRREAETWITEGRVALNGKIVKELGAKLQPGVDSVTVDGRPLSHEPPPRVYWILHKPDEVLTSRADGSGRTTIYDLPALRRTSFLFSPVGRLDYRTEGLLILTNDGELAFRLSHPRFHMPRHYHVLVTGRLTPEEERKIRTGVKLEDGPTGKAELEFAHGKNLGASRGSWYTITVYEGRNRLVRRLFEHVGHKVVKLLRVGFGDLRLPPDLEPGQYRQLSSSQIAALKRAVELKGAPRGGKHETRNAP